MATRHPFVLAFAEPLRTPLDEVFNWRNEKRVLENVLREHEVGLTASPLKKSGIEALLVCFCTADSPLSDPSPLCVGCAMRAPRAASRSMLYLGCSFSEPRCTDDAAAASQWEPPFNRVSTIPRRSPHSHAGMLL